MRKQAQRAREVIGPLTAISRMETGEYGVEIGGAIYFAIFITIGAFIGINLLVVVVTTNLEQMMKAEQGHHSSKASGLSLSYTQQFVPLLASPTSKH